MKLHGTRSISALTKRQLCIYNEGECIRIAVGDIKTVQTPSTLIVDSLAVRSHSLRLSFRNSWSADYQWSAKHFQIVTLLRFWISGKSLLVSPAHSWFRAPLDAWPHFFWQTTVIGLEITRPFLPSRPWHLFMHKLQIAHFEKPWRREYRLHFHTEIFRSVFRWFAKENLLGKWSRNLTSLELKQCPKCISQSVTQ
jgi:hypothetical protein